MKKTPRIVIPQIVRKYVHARDNYHCQSCGQSQQEAKLTIDHINPLARGGSNDISNLQTLCRICNNKKKDKLDNRFKRRFTK